jgi:hypothetical protein
MNTRIENRPVFTTLTVTLDAGESFRAEGGAMVSMSTTVELQSKATSKGFGGLLKSAVGGEGLFASEFTASGGPGEVVLAPPTPGDIIEFNLAGQTLFAQSGAYLAGTNGLELGTKGSLKSMLSGKGFFSRPFPVPGPSGSRATDPSTNERLPPARRTPSTPATCSPSRRPCPTPSKRLPKGCSAPLRPVRGSSLASKVPGRSTFSRGISAALPHSSRNCCQATTSSGSGLRLRETSGRPVRRESRRC